MLPQATCRVLARSNSPNSRPVVTSGRTSGVGRGAIRDYDVGMGHACGLLMSVLEDPNGFSNTDLAVLGTVRCLPNAR